MFIDSHCLNERKRLIWSLMSRTELLEVSFKPK